MKLRRRFQLVGAGVLIFLIASPVIVFYSLGYRYSLRERRIIGSGLIVARTDPRGARIFLDGKRLARRTPANLRFLKPGMHHIRIEREGYHAWGKNLDVWEGEATWLRETKDDLALFRKDIRPETLAEEGVIGFALSPDSSRIVYAKKQEADLLIEVMHLRDRSKHTVLRRTFTPFPYFINPSFQWFPDVSMVLTTLVTPTGTEYLITDLQGSFLGEKSATSQLVSDLEIAEIRPFSAPLRENFLLALTKNQSLYFLATNGQEKRELGRGIRAFALDGNTLLLLRSANEGSSLVFQSLDNEHIDRVVSLKEEVNKAKFVAKEGNDNILLTDGKLFRMDNTGDTELIATDVEDANFDEHDKLLFYRVGREFWMYDRERALRAQITSNKVSIIFPFYARKMQAILTVDTQALTAFELDGRDRRQRFDLLALQNLAHASLNVDGDTLYILQEGKLMQARLH